MSRENKSKHWSAPDVPYGWKITKNDSDAGYAGFPERVARLRKEIDRLRKKRKDIKMKKPTCETCDYWEANPGNDLIGLCRFRAPNECNDECWPSTSHNDWCGKHQDFGWWQLGKSEAE